MSMIRDLVNTLGISQEEAESLLASLGAKEKTKELEALGVAFKEVDDIELGKMTRAELKDLYVAIGKLLKKPTARASDTKPHPIRIKLVYNPEKAYVHPLAKTCEEGISAIEEARINVRVHKGSGRWSNPPIELTCTESIEAIERWREEH